MDLRKDSLRRYSFTFVTKTGQSSCSYEKFMMKTRREVIPSTSEVALRHHCIGRITFNVTLGRHNKVQ